jgi:hypothetical protein
MRMLIWINLIAERDTQPPGQTRSPVAASLVELRLREPRALRSRRQRSASSGFMLVTSAWANEAREVCAAGVGLCIAHARSVCGQEASIRRAREIGLGEIGAVGGNDRP